MTRSQVLGPYLILGLGVAVVSTASILIRYAQAEGVPSLSIAAVRLGLAALVLTPIVWIQAGRELLVLRRRDFVLALFSGMALAIHFWSWIASLAYTSVASSTVLVTTNPLWVGLASMLILRERPGRRTIGGIALTLAGGLFIFLSAGSGAGVALETNPVRGNLLALLGAVSASAYLLVGRALRPHVGLLVYVWLSYGTAALLLLLAVGVTGHALTGYSTLAYAVMIGLALGPQLFGHTAFNWALRHVSATFVAISILGEPIGSAMLARLFFDERFASWQLVGFLLLLGGIYLAARGEVAVAVASGEHMSGEEEGHGQRQDRVHGDNPSTGHDSRAP
jgi:drug/metabolite transporter (DMT)-like permease